MARTGRWLLALLPPLVLGGTAAAQEQTESFQTWYDYDLVYVFRPRWLLTGEVTAKALLTDPDESGWSAVEFSPSVTYSPSPEWDLIGSALVSSTVQEEGVGTLELRLTTGARVNIRPSRRVVVRNRLLVDLRDLNFTGTDSAQRSVRVRNRMEVRTAVNKPDYAANKLLYAFSYLETFINVGEAPSERFLQQLKFRLGLGYRFSHYWTTEVIYSIQQSENTLGTTFSSSRDHILNFRLIHFIN
jgi:hypothetical protein